MQSYSEDRFLLLIFQSHFRSTWVLFISRFCLRLILRYLRLRVLTLAYCFYLRSNKELHVITVIRGIGEVRGASQHKSKSGNKIVLSLYQRIIQSHTYYGALTLLKISTRYLLYLFVVMFGR